MPSNHERFLERPSTSSAAAKTPAIDDNESPAAAVLLQRKLQRRALQRRERDSAAVAGDSLHEAALRGVAGAGGELPHAESIQKSFGRHDVSHVEAHVGGAARDAAASIGAEAYATGNQVAFAAAPDLHTAAHEAAHVIQQRGGVQLAGGVGESGDPYERHADAVADTVVRGESAQSLLDAHAGGGPGVQRIESGAVQLRGDKARKAHEDNDLEGLDVTEAHMFEGEVEGTDPKGLHAYTNGAPPAGVTVLATIGNANSIHTIIWTKGAAAVARRAKWSSMFPLGMPKGTVCYYLQHGPGAVDGTGVKEGKGAKVGTGWGVINVVKRGDTMFPGGAPDWKSSCTHAHNSWKIRVGAIDYTITNP